MIPKVVFLFLSFLVITVRQARQICFTLAFKALGSSFCVCQSKKTLNSSACFQFAISNLKKKHWIKSYLYGGWSKLNIYKPYWERKSTMLDQKYQHLLKYRGTDSRNISSWKGNIISLYRASHIILDYLQSLTPT